MIRLTRASLRAVLASLALLLLLSACTSRWEREFTPAPLDLQPAAPGATAPTRAAAPTPTLREITWERMARALEEENALLTNSSAHPSQWSDQERADATIRLLAALQVTDAPPGTNLIGKSRFRTTDRLDPQSGELAALARARGASLVVFATTVLGKADVVTSEPVTQWRSGSVVGPRGPDGKRRGSDFSETSTTFVPVVRQADEFAYAAVFVRFPPAPPPPPGAEPRR